MRIWMYGRAPSAGDRPVTDLYNLPELGVGLIYWPSFERLLDIDEYLIDVLEVEPQPFWFAPRSSTAPYELDRRAFDHLRQLPQPKLVHGVGFPVGGTVAPDSRQIESFVESINVLGAPWASEHLSFNRVHRGPADIDVGFLLPPLQSSEGVGVAVKNISALKARLPVPFAFETGVSYLRPMHDELSDGAFFAAVALGADCGILLDLHNVWANERNGRQPVDDLVNELPVERVLELHLAGGQDYDGYWVDAHSNLIPSAVMDLARRVIPRLPNLKAIIYEVMPEYVVANGISSSQLADQFCMMRELWELRGRAADSPRKVQSAVVADSMPRSLPSPPTWENALSTAVTRKRPPPPEVGLLGDLLKDPGTAVLRRLISAVRAGKVADTLTLTTRLLLLTLGEQGMQNVFDDFWDSVPTEQMASAEAQNFATHITSSTLGAQVRYLPDVAGFELAAHQAVMTGEPQNVAFSVNPELLLSALRDGRLPPALAPGNFEVTVAPPLETPRMSYAGS
jgi:uncharacterized protein